MSNKEALGSKFTIMCEKSCLNIDLTTKFDYDIPTKLASTNENVPKKIVLRLHGCCGGAVASVVSIFAQ